MHASSSVHGRVVEAQVAFVEQTLVQPLILSTGPIERLTEAQVRVTVSTAAGEARGAGSIYLSDLWAWPDPRFTHAHRDAALRNLCEMLAARLAELVGGPAHPLELGLRLHDAVGELEADIPALARAMCLSPFDAAIHDAVGNALGVSAMRLYDAPQPSSADRWFPGGSAFAAIRALLCDPPRDSLPAWVVVGKQDDPHRDIRPWWDERGYRCFKLKLHGRDVGEDVQRTAEVARAAGSWGCRATLSVDTNEACPDAAFVLEYLQALQRHHPEAYDALGYLEQPTARDIVAHPHDWRTVTRMKPVLLDEGLTSLDLLPVAAEQGWSGLALKTCKGHSFALVAAAWAQARGMAVALQDLTNPGIAAVHAAVLAAHLPTVNGVELNSPQFTPAANAACLDAWPGLFDVREGVHRVADPMVRGLGGMA